MSVFPLVRSYRPALFRRVAGELDRTTRQLAERLHGKVEGAKTVTVAGIRSRQYELAFNQDGTDYRQRMTFVLRGSTEYQLLCRWAASDGEPDACALLTGRFRLA